jgi:hypothetical protein
MNSKILFIAFVSLSFVGENVLAREISEKSEKNIIKYRNFRFNFKE